jgi:hypothetical protein
MEFFNSKISLDFTSCRRRKKLLKTFKRKLIITKKEEKTLDKSKKPMEMP